MEQPTSFEGIRAIVEARAREHARVNLFYLREPAEASALREDFAQRESFVDRFEFALEYADVLHSVPLTHETAQRASEFTHRGKNGFRELLELYPELEEIGRKDPAAERSLHIDNYCGQVVGVRQRVLLRVPIDDAPALDTPAAIEIQKRQTFLLPTTDYYLRHIKQRLDPEGVRKIERALDTRDESRVRPLATTYFAPIVRRKE